MPVMPGSLESSAAVAPALTLFARYEHVAKDELFLADQPLYGRTFTIQKALGRLRLRLRSPGRDQRWAWARW